MSERLHGTWLPSGIKPLQYTLISLSYEPYSEMLGEELYYFSE